jgi:hypothetical protein
MLPSALSMPGLEPSYYRGALSLLQFVEQRTQSRRRFGAEADATWKQFRGELTTADRIQLLLSDAHAQWPGAVGASNVCRLPGVSEDDAFGPDWQPLGGVEAEDLWRDVGKASPPGSVESALATIAAAWGLTLDATVTVPSVTPSSKVVVAGPSAVTALVQHFAQNTDLDWARQVTAIATSPAHRQIAAAVGVLLNLTVQVPLLASDAPVSKLPGAIKFISSDATPEDTALAKKMAV